MIRNKGQGMGLGSGGEYHFPFHIVSEISASFCSEDREFELGAQ